MWMCHCHHHQKFSSDISSSDSGVNTCLICGTCVAHVRSRSRDLDRCLCLSPPGACSSSSSSPSLIGIGISGGSAGEGRGMQSLTRCISCRHSFFTTSRWWRWWQARRSWRLMRFRRCRRLWILWVKANFRIIKESNVWRRLLIMSVSTSVLRYDQLGLTSRLFFPEHNHCPRTCFKCGTEEIVENHTVRNDYFITWLGSFSLDDYPKVTTAVVAQSNRFTSSQQSSKLWKAAWVKGIRNQTRLYTENTVLYTESWRATVCRIIQNQVTLTRHIPVRSYSLADSDERVVIDQYSTQTEYSAKSDVGRLPYALKNPLQLPVDSREGWVVYLSPMTRICQ